MGQPLRIAVVAIALLAVACADDADPGASSPTQDIQAHDVVGADGTAGDAAPIDGVAADVPVGNPDTPNGDSVALDADTPPNDGHQGDALDPDAVSPPAPTGLCAATGQAVVRQLASGERLEGPASLGGEGDWLLANDVAAFVIQAPLPEGTPLGEAKTYYYYGGLPIDAAPVAPSANGCVQRGPDLFGEVAFAVGWINAGDFAESVLRGFDARSVEVLADGAGGGPVTLRVHGVDSPFWLVEYELIRRVAGGGGTKPFSDPLGVTLAIDYTLTPGDPVLRVDLRITNTTDQARTLYAGSVSFPSDETDTVKASTGTFSIGGFALETGLPWMAGHHPEASWAFGGDGIQYATVGISGAEILLDLGQLVAPLELDAAADTNPTAVQTWYLSVTAGGSDGASAALATHLPGADVAPFRTITGLTRIDGAGVSARVDALRAGPSGTPQVFMSAQSDAQGVYSLQVPDSVDISVMARVAEEASTEAVPLPVGDTLSFDLPPPGVVRVDVRDQDGAPIPARLQLLQGNTQRQQVFATGVATEVRLPPGDYVLRTARGYEYDHVELPVTVVAHSTVDVPVTLNHVVPTPGWASFDGHVHAAPSGDSRVPMVERIRSAAADGLDLIGHTDHEILYDPAPDLAASGVAAWTSSLPGEELTATTPEHLSVWGLWPDPDHPRGRPIVWYKKDLPTLFAEVHARGAMVALNHPRTTNSCAYLCLIDWDRVAGAPGITDPTRVGLPADAQLWSWDLDALELMNGLSNVFALGLDKRAGVFDDWMSFLNHGHRVPGVASTDEHGLRGIGTPRTYFQTDQDDPAKLTEEDLRDALTKGAITLSAGAFALARVGDVGPGGTVKATEGAVALSLDVRGQASIDVERVSVFVNCDEVLRVPATDPNGTQKLLTTVSVATPVDAHVVVVAFGTQPMPAGFDGADPARAPRAIVNPIFVDADGDGVWTPPGGKLCSYSLDPIAVPD